MPSGIVSIASTFIVGFGIRHTSHRWAWLVACCIPGILGGALMSFATGTKAGQLAGIYLVNSITATLIVIYQWTGSNVGGQTKRVISVALVSGSFSVGNIIGPQTFQWVDLQSRTQEGLLTPHSGRPMHQITSPPKSRCSQPKRLLHSSQSCSLYTTSGPTNAKALHQQSRKTLVCPVMMRSACGRTGRINRTRPSAMCTEV